MKKQFTKIKIAAENLSRSTKQDRKDFELEVIEKQVDKYRDVLERMVRKLPAVSTSTDSQEREKRIKKNSHYKIGQALEESSKELSRDMPLLRVMESCGELEKSLAECIVNSELETETEVVRRLKLILDNEIQEISTLKRNVSRTIQEYASLKRSYEAAIRLDEPQSKINSLKEQQEQCEIKLEKERDQWAAQMFELIAKEDVIVHCIRDYVLNLRNYHERALCKVNSSLAQIQDIIQSTVKSRFGTSLHEHLASTQREISYIIELCVCCLVEHGLNEEGLLRVGCANTKLRRMKHALEAQYVKAPLPVEYQDPHVIGSILKLYLRELPEPLLTYRYCKDFIHAVEITSEVERKKEIKAILAKLPAENYANLRYLTKFLWLVTQYVEQNKMTSQNLAIVMSPNMLWPRMNKNNPADYIGQVNSSSAVNIIVEMLISQWDYFFEGEVDFFVTLQRNRLFVEGKSKSNSSNENLDKHDDVHESPRYGTIKRQKPYAPSPPAKTTEKTPHQGNNDVEVHYRNGERIKQTLSGNSAKTNGTNHVGTSTVTLRHVNYTQEKPEKPPLPKVLQPQSQQSQQMPASVSSSTQMPPPPAVPQQSDAAGGASTPKPVPMTRTQFFGLDNLPSPVADRKSTDSISSMFKPDLPQKPKLPKRPVALSLNQLPKSDDERTTTTTPPTQTHTVNGAIILRDSNYITDKASRRSVTEKFLDSLRQDNCDNNIIDTTAAAAATTTLSKEENHNNNHSNDNSVNQNQEAGNSNITTTMSHKRTFSNASTNSNSNSISSNHVSSSENQKQQQDIATTTTTTTTSAASATSTYATPTTRTTPTTPISPSMLTPKRPTIPAPPPPSVVKKQTE